MKSSLRQTATPQHRSRPRGNDRPRPKAPSSSQHPRRRFLGLAAGAVLPAVSRLAWAQAYPARPVRIVVAFPAGGTHDITARIIGQWLSERTVQSFLIDNRPGANGTIGTQAAANASPDGYTLVLLGNPQAVNVSLYGKLAVNLTRDLVPVAGISRLPMAMVVHPSVPAKTVPEFIAYANANPGKMNMASGGNGNGTHVAGALFMMMSGVKMLHVPYRGGAPAITDLLAGQMQVYFGSMPEILEHIRAGKLRALGVTTATRLAALPEVPTLGEFVSGYEASGWTGLAAPKGTPADVIEKLNREINAGLTDPRIEARFAELGSPPLPLSPANFGRLMAEETEKWAKVIQAANIKPQ
jgi:tripartite-type tricarboxylate transporter receptor subunit TctC